jgi:hypothetical protein
MQVFNARVPAGYKERDRLPRQALRRRVSSCEVIQRPTLSCTRSIFTSGWMLAQSRFLRRIALSVPISRFTVFGAAPCDSYSTGIMRHAWVECQQIAANGQSRGDIILEDLRAKRCTLTSVVNMTRIDRGYFIPRFSPSGFDIFVAYVLTS